MNKTQMPNYYPDPEIGRPISLAKIYAGEVGKDPQNFPVQIVALQEDGNIVNIDQPVRTGAGGTPLLNGSNVTLFVDGSYSLKVLDSSDSQKYNIPEVVAYATLEDLAEYVTAQELANYATVVETVDDLVDDLGTTTGIAWVKDSIRGGQFTYNASLSAVNDGGVIFNGWVRVVDEYVNVAWFGGVQDTDIHLPLQKAINYAQSIYNGESIPVVNATAAIGVRIPAGRYTLSSRVEVTQGGVHVFGDGVGATLIKTTTNSGGIIFRHPDYLDGQNIDNCAITDLQFLGTASASASTDTAITAVVTKFFRVQNTRTTNFSQHIDLIAAEEPVHLLNNTHWHDNSQLTSTTSVRLLALAVNPGTPNAAIDPDSLVEYYKPSMVFMDNCEMRAKAGICESHVVVDSVDGFYVTNCHFLNGSNQLKFNPKSSALPISNVVWSGVFFDGGVTDTIRNLYVVQKVFVSQMDVFMLSFNGCKFNGANDENILLNHEDLTELIISGGMIDVCAGAYMINAQQGRRVLSLDGVRFRMGSGGPTFGAVVLDARNSSFFNITRFKDCLFYHDDSIDGFPARYIQIESDGTNTPQFIFAENEYLTYAGLTSGFIDDNSAPAVTVTDRNNISFI